MTNGGVKMKTMYNFSDEEEQKLRETYTQPGDVFMSSMIITSAILALALYLMPAKGCAATSNKNPRLEQTRTIQTIESKTEHDVDAPNGLEVKINK